MNRTILFIAVLGALCLVGCGAYLLKSSQLSGLSTTDSSEVIEKYRSLWDYKLTGAKASKCAYFVSPEEALQALQLDVRLFPCKEDVKRVIGFIEDENLYGFVTCIPIEENNYFCCAELSTVPTKSYNTWKSRCT